MNIPTPDTDALDEKLSDFNWDEGYGKLLEHSRKLERERDEAIEKAAAFEQAVQDERNIHMTTIAERDQLRKVCDELEKALMRQLPITAELGEVKWDAVNLYNSLPHIIAAKKGNAE